MKGKKRKKELWEFLEECTVEKVKFVILPLDVSLRGKDTVKIVVGSMCKSSPTLRIVKDKFFSEADKYRKLPT